MAYFTGSSNFQELKIPKQVTTNEDASIVHTNSKTGTSETIGTLEQYTTNNYNPGITILNGYVIASDAGGGDFFGSANAMFNEILVIGAFSEDGAGGVNANRGAAYIYRKIQVGYFGQIQKITASSPADGDTFGFSVAISNNVIVIGSPGVTGGGAVHIFNKNIDGTWGDGSNNENQILTGSDIIAGNQFGYSVAIYNDTIVVGAKSKNSSTGALYVFNKRSDGTWGNGSNNENQILTTSDAAADDQLGYSVSIYNDVICAGAAFDDIVGADRGSVYIYNKNANGTWGSSNQENQKLTAATPITSGYLGRSVSIYQNTIVAGSDGVSTNAGRAYIFNRRSDGTWGNGSNNENQIIVGSDTVSGDRFGFSVSIYSDYIVVGAYSKTEGGTARGAAYMFARNTSNTFNQVSKLVSDDPQNNDNFGYSVFTYTNNVIIGAPGKSGSGRSYMFGESRLEKGALHVQSAHNSVLWLQSDLDNNVEDGHPTIYLTQDGQVIGGYIGIGQPNTTSNDNLMSIAHNDDIIFYNVSITSSGSGSLPTFSAYTEIFRISTSGIDTTYGLSAGSLSSDTTITGDRLITTADSTTAGTGNELQWRNLILGNNGLSTSQYSWIIGPQATAPSSTDNDLYFGVIRNSSFNTAAYVQDSVTNIQMNFTGQHRCRSLNDEINQKNINNYVGMIVKSTGKYSSIDIKGNVITDKNAIQINDALPIVELTIIPNDKSVFGVISSAEDENESNCRRWAHGAWGSILGKTKGDDRLFINGLGEGAVWVTNINGILENGDYITTSEIPGYGMKQNDDLLHNYTVAKITCNCDFDLNSNIYKCEEFIYNGVTYKKAFVGCVYTCS